MVSTGLCSEDFFTKFLTVSREHVRKGDRSYARDFLPNVSISLVNAYKKNDRSMLGMSRKFFLFR